MTDTPDLHMLTGAYALDALEDEERQAFEAHLTRCAACEQEVRELSAAAARLGLAATLSPPAHLKNQVMGRITEVRQEPPHAPVSVVYRQAPRGRALRWALAACVAGMAVLGGTTVWQHHQADEARRQAWATQVQSERIAEVLSAPDAKVASAAVTGGAHGSVVVSRSRDKAVFIASGMAEPPKGKVYELWFADGDHMRPAGLMDPSRADQSVLLAGAVGEASGMGVTLEPAGGSKQPTTQPLALLDLPA
ncbi:anti-sigma factor domain-containing protein [Streptomyces sp. VRA16 Mangrove soil]|uniref:anti-sigma factor n=1 Tax=Streptomyces sp. VRA16 Mangrove soil TaxID=2817434 RepID=UPI001A9FAE88|nr:anti-sigma factor [Streptomyces sp. VRA16 Mangrove soil]MBO1330802.1 anti-sigma factor [Streptomyces sp. VRA16 Mangrove soil]